MSNHDRYMGLAVELAHKSEAVDSAYCVGCVIVDGNTLEVLSTGFSRQLPGNTHAEECALATLPRTVAPGAILYTTMEPCSKRLSGKACCVARILRSPAIAHVVVGAAEPPNFVQCTGIQQLRDAHVQVTVLDHWRDRCLEPNRHIVTI